MERRFRLNDRVICTETGEVGVVLELHSETATVSFSSGVRDAEYLDLLIIGHDNNPRAGFDDGFSPLR
mgnify:CR=1 FL=1